MVTMVPRHWCRLGRATSRGVLCRSPTLAELDDDRTLVVPEEVVVVKFLLNLGTVVAVSFESECVVGDVLCKWASLSHDRSPDSLQS